MSFVSIKAPMHVKIFATVSMKMTSFQKRVPKT